VPGPQSFPGNIVSYLRLEPDSALVTFHLTGAFSPTWFTYNELSQIVPIPEAWDVTSLTGAPGSGGCGKFSSGPMTGAATMKALRAVWKFDTDNNGQSKTPQMASDLSTYGSNKLWLDGADGPFVLSAFDSSSGPGHLRAQPELQRAAEADSSASSSRCRTPLTPAEYSALSSRWSRCSRRGLHPASGRPAVHGQSGWRRHERLPGGGQLQPRSRRDLADQTTSRTNFNSTGDGGQAGAIFKQLPVRQAIQDGIDQLGIIKGYYKGYGVPTYGPVPAYPPNPFESSLEKSPNGPYRSAPRRGWPFSGPTAGACTPAGPTPAPSRELPPAIAERASPRERPSAFSEVYESGSVTLTEAVTDGWRSGPRWESTSARSRSPSTRCSATPHRVSRR